MIRAVLALTAALFLSSPSPTFAKAADPVAEMLDRAYAGDTEGVRAALAAAPDLAARRRLFAALGTTDPRLGTFTESWLQAAPDDAQAMTARGWHLHAMGWAMRGTGFGSDLYPDAIALMQQYHAEAWNLSQTALAADPDLIPASDLMLDLARTLGQTDLVEDEFTRAMTLAPNRQTLQLAALAMSPRWGGQSLWSTLTNADPWAKTACAEWAAKVEDVPDYTPDICHLDMIFTSGERDEIMGWAAYAVMIEPHPILDHARNQLWDYPMDLGGWERDWLEQQLANDTITLLQANRLDIIRNGPSAGRATGPLSPEVAAVVKRELPKARLAADRDPGNAIVVFDYLELLSLSLREKPEDPAISAEFTDRNARLLDIAPYAPEGWERLAGVKAFEMKDSEDLPATVKAMMDLQARAVVYSGQTSRYLSTFLNNASMAKGQIDWRNKQSTDKTGKPAFDAETVDAVLTCPMVKGIRLMQEICRNPGTFDYSCGMVSPESSFVEDLIEVAERGGCPAELAARGNELLFRLPAE